MYLQILTIVQEIKSKDIRQDLENKYIKTQIDLYTYKQNSKKMREN